MSPRPLHTVRVFALTLSAIVAVAAGAPVNAGADAAATSPKLAAVQAAGKLQVCIWPHYHGISMRDARFPEPLGVDADMARAFARELNVTLEFVDSEFGRIVPDLNADRCDLAMTGLLVLPERQAVLRFAKPHLRTDMYAVVAKNNRVIQRWRDLDQPGIAVGVVAGSHHHALMRERMRYASVTPFEHNGARELEAGRIDAYIVTFPFTRRVIDRFEWARVIVPERSFQSIPMAYAVRAGDELWLARLDQFVATIKRDGRLTAAAKRYGLGEMLVRD